MHRPTTRQFKPGPVSDGVLLAFADASWRRPEGYTQQRYTGRVRGGTPNAAGFCRILPDLAGFCRILPDFAGFCLLGGPPLGPSNGPLLGVPFRAPPKLVQESLWNCSGDEMPDFPGLETVSSRGRCSGSALGLCGKGRFIFGCFGEKPTAFY